MAEEVDYEARKDSQKALSVILILAIIAATSYFFYVFLDRRFRFFYSTRKFIIVILACGDLFIALFSLFVLARQIYEKRYRPGCSTTMCAFVYYSSYFPFVYATGLICLCVELLFRQRIRNIFSKPEHCSVIVAGIPWIIGLILILPLTLAGMDWDNCRFDSDSNSTGRQRAIVWISVVLPSTVAVICCFIVKQVKFNVIPKGRFPDPEGQPIGGETSRPQYPPPAPQKSVQSEGASEDNGVDQSEPNIYTYGSAPSQPAVLPNPQPSEIPPTSYTSLDNAQPIVLTTNQLEALVEKEKTDDLLIAVLFFVLTMPFALFTLGYTLNDDVEELDPVPHAVLNDLFFWLVFTRSIVLPVVWARITSQVL